MTENEAIEIIRDKIETCEFYFAEHDRYPEWCEYEFLEALGIAISALEEIQQYRAIGTVEECREAVEKQEAIEVIRIAGRYPYKCPTCNGKLEIGYKHCIRCGQLLKYSYDKL